MFARITEAVGVEWMALIIIGVTLVLFLIDKLPIAITALLSSLALALFKCMDYEQVYAGFSSTLVAMMLGIMILGEALFETGAVLLIGKQVLKAPFARNERVLILVLMTITGVISAFLSNTATIATFIPLVGALVVTSGKHLKNKHILMPLGIAASVGGTITLVGSTSQPMVNSILLEAGEKPLGMFDFAYVAIPCFIALLIYMSTIGYTIMKKTFKFEDQITDSDASIMENFQPNSKTWISLVIMALCIIGFATSVVPISIVGLLGGAAAILTGCIDFKECMKRLDWNTILLMAFAQGIAAGMNDSGAGQMIAEYTVSVLGNNITLMYVACVVITVILTNIMSNTATAAMLTPIYLTICSTLGYESYIFAMGIAIASNLSVATPIGGTAMSQTLVAGYRFNDFIKLGGPITIIMTIILCIMGPVVFGFHPL